MAVKYFNIFLSFFSRQPHDNAMAHLTYVAVKRKRKKSVKSAGSSFEFFSSFSHPPTSFSFIKSAQQRVTNSQIVASFPSRAHKVESERERRQIYTFISIKVSNDLCLLCSNNM
jgi:hypothetical protein